jgi:hypothetical protein
VKKPAFAPECEMRRCDLRIREDGLEGFFGGEGEPVDTQDSTDISGKTG